MRMMPPGTPIVLDTRDRITLRVFRDPKININGLLSLRAGLFFLAQCVRQDEIALVKERKDLATALFGGFPRAEMISCFFAWFSVSLVNYLRGVGLVGLMTHKSWKKVDLAANRSEIRSHCRQYAEEAAPDVVAWRHKIAAHFAATDPLASDNTATLELSLLDPISYERPRFYAGSFGWGTAGQEAHFPRWSLTDQYECLAPRFWPQQRLKPTPEVEKV